jgi:hypothetical protein
MIDRIVIAALALATAAYVIDFHFPAPYFDHWDLVPMMRAADAGSLTPGDLFAIHGGHWHASAYALLLPLAQITGWSQLAEALLTLALLGATCVLLVRMAADFAKHAAPEAALGPFVIAALFLCMSLDQSSNLLWGFQVSVFVSVFGTVLCLWALTGAAFTWREALIAQAGLAIAVTSYATGFALVPTGLALIALRTDATVARRLIIGAIWLGVGAAWCVAFVAAQAHAPYGGGFDTTLLSRGDFWAYLAAFEINYLGSSIARVATALIWPLAVLAPLGALAGAWALHRGGISWRTLSMPLTLIVFSIGAGLLCGLGRFEFGAGQGGNGRYFSFSHLFWIGAAFIGFALLARVRGKALRGGAIALIALLAVLKLASGVQAAQKNTRVTAEVAVAAAEMRADPAHAGAAARAISFERQDAEANAAYIRDKGWSVFR